jgi:hypothetical protein
VADPEFMNLAAPLMQYLYQQQAKHYPDALISGISYPVRLLMAYARTDATPAALVAENMLVQTTPNDFMVNLKDRRYDEVGTYSADPEDLQGFVDAVTLYIAASFAFLQRLPPQQMSSVVDAFPPLQEMDDAVRAKTRQFVTAHSAWAIGEIKRRDLDDGKDLMDKLVKRIAAQQATGAYQRGIRTARDTLSLHVDLIQAFPDWQGG